MKFGWWMIFDRLSNFVGTIGQVEYLIGRTILNRNLWHVAQRAMSFNLTSSLREGERVAERYSTLAKKNQLCVQHRIHNRCCCSCRHVNLPKHSPSFERKYLFNVLECIESMYPGWSVAPFQLFEGEKERERQRGRESKRRGTDNDRWATQRSRT